MGLVAPRYMGSSQTRARTCVPCIGRQILNHCATREAPQPVFIDCPLYASHCTQLGIILTDEVDRNKRILWFFFSLDWTDFFMGSYLTWGCVRRLSRRRGTSSLSRVCLGKFTGKSQAQQSSSKHKQSIKSVPKSIKFTKFLIDISVGLSLCSVLKGRVSCSL